MKPRQADRQLDTHNHDRDVAGMTYVYPVVSRRAGGVSLGINLNPNNACNWRCVYCQVPDLQRGAAPPIDLTRLRDELAHMLDAIVHGDYLQRHVPEGMRRLNDIAFSGNGEPTSAAEFPAAVEIVAEQLAARGLTGQIKVILITNGSLATRKGVQTALRHMAQIGGEVWFKLDRADAAGLRLVNGTQSDPERHYQRLCATAALCPTWVQTCMFARDGLPPEESAIATYLALLARAAQEKVPLQGVLLYGLARTPMQPGAERLTPLDPAWLNALAAQIEALGWRVRVSP